MLSADNATGPAKISDFGKGRVALPVSASSLVFKAIKSSPLQSAFLARSFNFLLKRSGKTYTATTYFGARIECDPSEFIQSRILMFGFWEPNISNVMEMTLQSGDVFVDIGANTGYDTLLASTLVGAQGRVVSIEASPKTFEVLCRQLQENRASNVRTVNQAVSDKAGTLTLYSGGAGDTGKATTIKSRGLSEEATIASAPLDQILTSEERSRLRLIKMDIEGGELPVLHRFLATTDLYPETVQVIVEASPQEDPSGWAQIFDRMQAAGFHPYLIENRYEYDWYLNWRRPTPPRQLARMPAEQSDILFTRQKPRQSSA